MTTACMFHNEMRHNFYQLKINKKKVVPKIYIVSDAKIENKKFY